MGKKRTRATYVSKGQHSNVSATNRKLAASSVSNATKELNLIRAWREGKNPWVTVKNSDRACTNRPFIRVRANDLYGNPKDIAQGIFRGKD